MKVVTIPNVFFKQYFKTIFLLGFCFRILCFFLPPFWEDDWARYLWEGNLIRNGISPYEVAPHHFFNQTFDDVTTEILSQINHPEWTTIYSPFVLLYFALFSYGFSTILLKS
ncbi:hypothetical protein EHQ59_08285, partial [Leptospira kemamanensis]